MKSRHLSLPFQSIFAANLILTQAQSLRIATLILYAQYLIKIKTMYFWSGNNRFYATEFVWTLRHSSLLRKDIFRGAAFQNNRHLPTLAVRQE